MKNCGAKSGPYGTNKYNLKSSKLFELDVLNHTFVSKYHQNPQ